MLFHDDDDEMEAGAKQSCRIASPSFGAMRPPRAQGPPKIAVITIPGAVFPKPFDSCILHYPHVLAFGPEPEDGRHAQILPPIARGKRSLNGRTSGPHEHQKRITVESHFETKQSGKA